MTILDDAASRLSKHTAHYSSIMDEQHPKIQHTTRFVLTSNIRLCNLGIFDMLSISRITHVGRSVKGHNTIVVVCWTSCSPAVVCASVCGKRLARDGPIGRTYLQQVEVQWGHSTRDEEGAITLKGLCQLSFLMIRYQLDINSHISRDSTLGWASLQLTRRTVDLPQHPQRGRWRGAGGGAHVEITVSSAARVLKAIVMRNWVVRELGRSEVEVLSTLHH